MLVLVHEAGFAKERLPEQRTPLSKTGPRHTDLI